MKWDLNRNIKHNVCNYILNVEIKIKLYSPLLVFYLILYVILELFGVFWIPSFKYYESTFINVTFFYTPSSSFVFPVALVITRILTSNPAMWKYNLYIISCNKSCKIYIYVTIIATKKVRCAKDENVKMGVRKACR